MSNENGIIHLWDLQEDNVCLKLPKEIQRSMTDNALSIVSSPKQLSNKLNINRTTFYDFKNARFSSVTLSFVQRLSSFLERHDFEEFSLNNLEKRVELIKTKWTGKSIFQPKFPIDFSNKEGAEIVSAFLFDGGIVHDLRPFYTNNEGFLVNKLIKNVKIIVGNIEFNKRTDDGNIRVEFPKILGHILVDGLEIIPGSKVIKNPPIPEFILQSKSKIIRAFLQQAFDDEGSVHPGKSGRSIQLSQYHSKSEPPMRLLQLKELIEKFNIPVNGPHGSTREHKAKRGYTSYGWVIQISNLSDIYSFARRIDFCLPRKRNKLRELIDSYVLPPRFKKGTIKSKILELCEELKKENEKITIKNVALKLDRCESWVAEVMRALVEEGGLTIDQEKSPNHTFRGGFSMKRFQLK